MNKENFFKKMQPYFDSGLTREICRTETECIISLGEVCYIACPYDVLDDETIGIYMNSEVVKEVINNPGYIYTIAEIVLKDLKKNEKLFFNFKITNMDNLKKWILENRSKSQIDPNLEEELIRMTSQKTK